MAVECTRRQGGFRGLAALVPSFTVVVATIVAISGCADPPTEPLDGKDGRPLALENFQPRSSLKLEAHVPPHARFPCVDIHVHPRYKLHSSVEGLDQFVPLMDEQHIAVCVSLDGGIGDDLEEHKKYLWSKYRDRFVIFANLDFRGAGRADDPATWDCQRPEFGRRAAEQLAAAKEQGASGLKFFKEFGLGWRNPDGALVKIDDPRWNPIWEACGRLGLPVLIHTADPVAFFEPVDAHNERFEELRRHPDWSFYGPQWPRHDELLAALMRVVARHPNTIFIGAHVANNAEDLRTVSQWLDAYPNLNVEIAARIGELGRQPFTSRKFFLDYSDRILFGTDGPRSRGRILPHWRMLETADEYFPYAEEPFPPQGLWSIYGLNLPDDVLRKVYSENAARLIPGVRERLEKWNARKAAAGP